MSALAFPQRPTLALPLPAQPSASSSAAAASAAGPSSTAKPPTASATTTATASTSTPPALPPPGPNIRRRSSVLRQSPSDDEGDDDDDGDDGEAEAAEAGGSKKRARRKKGVGTGGAGTAAGAGAPGAAGAAAAGTGAREGEYKYLAEIGQMMFVFGEVQDPLPETIKLVEDIVRGQVIEMVTRARLLTHLRASRYLSAEDLIFLIREDRGKVNRLRTYLSWKDVRKRAKEEEEGDVELVDEKALKSRRTMVKLPWELLTPFSDFLKGLPSSQNRAGEDDDDEDEDEMQAYQDSMQRLRDADEITKKMTKDEYVHYSDCRQASFTYRKAKRFREFINFAAYLDVRPNDDIVDILGFLSFEMVRSLCVTALEVRDKHLHPIPVPVPAPTIAPAAAPVSAPSSAQRGVKRGHTGDIFAKRGSPEDTTVSVNANASTNANTHVNGYADATGNPSATTTTTFTQGAAVSTPPANSDREGTHTLPTSARKNTAASVSSASASGAGGVGAGAGGAGLGGGAHYPLSLFAPPPSARQPLLPAHVLEAFAQIQRQQANIRGGGLRHWRGGVGRNRMALV